MAVVRVALAFAKFSDGDLDNAARTVHDEMVANAALFPSPPVTMVNFQAAIDDFSDKISAAAVGGKVDTGGEGRLAAGADRHDEAVGALCGHDRERRPGDAAQIGL